MNDHTPFLATILEAPEEEVNYCVYADWLEDNGEEKLSRVLLAMVACRRVRKMMIGTIFTSLQTRQLEEAQAELRQAIIATTQISHSTKGTTDWGNWCGWIHEKKGIALWTRNGGNPTRFLTPDGEWVDRDTYFDWSDDWSDDTTSASTTSP